MYFAGPLKTHFLHLQVHWLLLYLAPAQDPHSEASGRPHEFPWNYFWPPAWRSSQGGNYYLYVTLAWI